LSVLLERGLVFAQTPAKLKGAMADVLENAEADHDAHDAQPDQRSVG